MDLVLDIWVNPDRTWEWKDQDDYRQAMRDGTLDRAIDDQLQAEAVRVIDEISKRVGPFDDKWLAFKPDIAWPRPSLSEPFAWGGDAWTLPTGPRLNQTR
jgi:hypothetical protein